MGLDIALCVLVLLVGIRGWLKGFLIQAIHLCALVGCIFLADPICDLARPYVADHFPKLPEDLLNRIMWWVAVVLGYLILSGVPSGLVRLYRKRPAAEMEPRWGDYGGGFVLGLAKGALVTLFLLWGFETYALERYKLEGGWVAEQIEGSHILPLARTYKPAEKIWTSSAVQYVVRRVRVKGFGEHETIEAGPASEAPGPISAQRPSGPVSASVIPSAVEKALSRASDPKSPNFLDEIDTALRKDGLTNSR